ncbi:uncharacterized protein Fot_31749 [Forsythia ovata]|uniref:Protein TIC 214 n=1 Tax=Forsythia ovata TaxID=205694 RepID=A0ABD1T5W8_9LAMI
MNLGGNWGIINGDTLYKLLKTRLQIIKTETRPKEHGNYQNIEEIFLCTLAPPLAEPVVGLGGHNEDNPENSTDISPESFWVSKDVIYDWIDRNTFYERKESNKGNSNSANLNSNINPGSNSNSQRYSVNLNSKASIIGLPKTQKTTYVDSRRRNCKPINIRLFPKRSKSVGKTTISMTEPSSPKFSEACMCTNSTIKEFSKGT